jgi:hypothetical protein
MGGLCAHASSGRGGWAVVVPKHVHAEHACAYWSWPLWRPEVGCSDRHAPVQLHADCTPGAGLTRQTDGNGDDKN